VRVFSFSFSFFRNAVILNFLMVFIMCSLDVCRPVFFSFIHHLSLTLPSVFDF